MKVFWIFAHPERRSLSGSLYDEGLRALRELGHTYQVSDLYAMKWKATVDADDFTEHDRDGRLIVTKASKQAYVSGKLSADILAEQAKLAWADAVVVQFPLWWFGLPAILKGWFDRVFVKGFAYGVTDPHDPRRTLRYGEGALTGKRALAVVTAGSREPAMGPRGINGELDQVLFPVLHGTFWYTGMSALPPVAIYGADLVDPAHYERSAALLHARLATLGDADPLPYRPEIGGDYDDDLVLRPEQAPTESGLGVHYLKPSR